MSGNPSAAGSIEPGDEGRIDRSTQIEHDEIVGCGEWPCRPGRILNQRDAPAGITQTNHQQVALTFGRAFAALQHAESQFVDIQLLGSHQIT